MRKGGEQCYDGSGDPVLRVQSEKAPREDDMEVGPGGIGPRGRPQPALFKISKEAHVAGS